MMTSLILTISKCICIFSLLLWLFLRRRNNAFCFQSQQSFHFTSDNSFFLFLLCFSFLPVYPLCFSLQVFAAASPFIPSIRPRILSRKSTIQNIGKWSSPEWSFPAPKAIPYFLSRPYFIAFVSHRHSLPQHWL